MTRYPARVDPGDDRDHGQDSHSEQHEPGPDEAAWTSLPRPPAREKGDEEHGERERCEGEARLLPAFASRGALGSEAIRPRLRRLFPYPQSILLNVFS